MRHFQIVFLILGLLYLGLAALAALVAITSLGLADGAAGGFFECAVAAGFIGGVLAVAGRGAAMDLNSAPRSRSPSAPGSACRSWLRSRSPRGLSR